MTAAFQTRRNRAVGLVEKTILGFVAGGAAFELGQRLQRDTDGLV